MKTGFIKFCKTNKYSNVILTLLHYVYIFILNYLLLLLLLLLLYELNTILHKGVAKHEVKVSLTMC